MNTTPRKYFIEDKRTGKWLKMPQSFDDCLIDTRRNSRDEEDRKWTNDPLLAMSFDTFDEAECHNKKFWNMVDIEVTEHEFVKSPTPPSGKKLTPMAAHIKWLQDKLCLPNSATSYMALTSALEHATSLLPEERDMFIDGCGKFGNYLGVNDDDFNDYFTNNYQQ